MLASSRQNLPLVAALQFLSHSVIYKLQDWNLTRSVPRNDTRTTPLYVIQKNFTKIHYLSFTFNYALFWYKIDRDSLILQGSGRKGSKKKE